MKTVDASASVYFNRIFYELITFSQGMLSYAEPDAPPYYLPANTDDAMLGHTLRLALKASRWVNVDEFQKIFHSGVVQQLGKDREAWAMKAYGYKSKRAMYRDMDSCSVTVAEGKIEIQPLHHKSLDGYSATKDGPQPLYAPQTATDAELGAALREGFKLCTSSVK